MRAERVPGRFNVRRLLRGARVRILASVMGLLVLSTLASLLVDRQLLLAGVGERVDADLVQEVEEFRRLVRDGRNPVSGEPFGEDVKSILDVFLQRNVPGEGEAFFTFVDGRPYRSTAPESHGRELLEAVPGLGRIRAVRRGDVSIAGDGRRYLAAPLLIGRRQRAVFAVAAPISHERAEVTEALQITAWVAIAVLLVASAVAFVISGRVLAPLREVTETARGITETDLTRRIPAEGKDEIAEMARTFNAMLDRLEEAFATQKTFLADAGHELRTPITIVRGHIELLDDDPQDREEVVALVCDELDRMTRLVDDLLVLARADRHDFLDPEPLDVEHFTRSLVAKATALAPRDWRLESAGEGPITADRQRLTQAMMNLARNAADHTAERGRIALGSSLDADRARFWVSDSGPGVPEEDRARIFERFARGDSAQRTYEGAGLGLAIVQAIAEAHGGEAVLEKNSSSGATFAITIPTEPRKEAHAA